MKIRYERQIRKFAQQTLERDLGKQVQPYLGDLNPEIKSLIETEVANYPVRERYGDGTIENLGSQLHSIGKRIAEQLYPAIFQQMLPHAERHIEREREALADRYTRSQEIESGIKSLQEQIRSGDIGKSRPYWRGADVIISPERIPRERLAWTHADDAQVVTGDDALASSLAWLFSRLGQIVSPLIDYMTKYEFYGEMAEGAIAAIDSNPENERAILEATIAEAEVFREKYQQYLDEYRAKRTREIEAARAWLAEIKNAPPTTAPKPPSNREPSRASSPNWERFHPSASGQCALERVGDDVILSGDYERGTLVTGKSEVFWGYYVSIRTETTEVVGKSQGDAGTYRFALDDCNRKLALDDCNRKLALDGLTLLAAGNVKGYSESALSGPAGFGYLKGHPGAVDILSRVDL
ncbi:MAG: hypothetical protein V9G98_03935 [Candidatus Competibacter sp.]